MATVNEIVVPDIGDFSDVPVIEVLVSPGDTVAENDSLIVLESDKATMEVPAPAGGVVESVAVSTGDHVSKGDLILTLSGGADDGDTSDADDDADAGSADEQTSKDADAASTADDDPAAEKAPPDDESAASSSTEDGRDEAASGNGSESAQTPRTAAPADGRPAAGPAARRAARELGIDLADVEGTGRAGRITLEDVARAARESGQGAGASGAPVLAGLPAWPTPDFAAFGEVERVPLSRIARISGPALARNWIAIPHVTQFDEADITDLEAFRREVNAEHEGDGVKVTMVSLLLKACSVALREFPAVNSSLDGEELILKRHYHLGFAADTPAGLMVPVIRDVDRKGLLGIARELAILSAAARDGSITREQMQGGTFTVSSLGGIGGTAFTPIINAPEVAILGVSRSRTTPVWNGRSFDPRLMLPLSFSYDHRVIDGAQAARFTTRLAELLHDPREMLL